MEGDLEDLILIRVLPGVLFPQDRTHDLRNDARWRPLRTARLPMACGPNVDQPSDAERFGGTGSGGSAARIQ
jgi:hypothetical protein